MSSTTTLAGKKGYRGLGMEGFIARWYAKTTGRNIADYRASAQAVAGQVADGASVLEVAPGPGYLAIELAKLGPYRIVGLDISESFVRMAAENATDAGVAVTFLRGNAAAMPFDPESFDLIVCRAAFKNFSEPVRALNETYRVLKPGGKALIHDLRSDASAQSIRTHVETMGLGRINSLMTKLALHMLQKRAYSQEQFRSMASETPFKACEIRADSFGLEVSLTK
jgi:ubiquinone/menaquinone biosynthesis C-methylase UbiE